MALTARNLPTTLARRNRNKGCTFRIPVEKSSSHQLSQNGTPWPEVGSFGARFFNTEKHSQVDVLAEVQNPQLCFGISLVPFAATDKQWAYRPPRRLALAFGL